jgi:F-type H+-transporting ATPase subunit alpha
MHAGKNVLIIYDDLSKHASSYRTISLLLKRSPGREAFPGDIFYLHSRLLERSCKLNEEKKGGSITCLPIIETQAGEISAYIPTNLISITDGQLFTQRSLFNEGQKPAIDVSLSVSRIGSAAQIKSIKKTASNIKIDIAQFLDVVAFNKFDDDIDEHTLKIIEHGKRIMILLKQNNDTYYSQIEEIIMLFAIKSKLIDFIPLNNILDFNEKLLNEFINNETIIKINKKKDISNEDENILFNDLRLYIKKYVSDIPGYDISNYFEESDKE